MKKLMITSLFLLCNCFIFAQRFEIIKEIKFGEPIRYYEKWDPIEGSNPGIYQIQNWKGQIILFDTDNHKYINLFDYNQEKKYNSLYNIVSYNQNDEMLVLGERGSINKIDIYKNSQNIQVPDYTIDFTNIKDKITFTLYNTDNKIFAKLSNNTFVYWELLAEGKTLFHDDKQTKYELENGLAEHIGLNKVGSQIYFGENCVTGKKAPNFSKYWKNIIIKHDKYEWLSSSFSTAFSYEGTDKRGLSYYSAVGNGFNIDLSTHPEIPFEYIVAVLDPWTHEVFIVELPEGDWNPARNSKGFIAMNSSCIDFEGNFYLTDCNKEKGCYEIKKLSNDWIKQYDFYKREIGIMNANHIPLYNELKSTADNNGYNFEHEYLWILEHKKDWCKVRKVDGREGWVETKYISFNEDKSNNNNAQIDSNKNNKISKTNVSINKKMICTDNLRLRSEEETSSQIITTMAKGTKVKILKLGKSEIIDNIPSNWVQVEILKDAKDKDGNPIKAGIIGWCYGGYLE